MRLPLLILSTISLGLTGLAAADELTIPAPAASVTAPTELPHKGQTTDAVRKQFGAAGTEHAPVGGGAPKQPPITRWDYPDFSVFFEKGHVIDTVVKGQPPDISNADELQPQ